MISPFFVTLGAVIDFVLFGYIKHNIKYFALVI